MKNSILRLLRTEWDTLNSKAAVSHSLFGWRATHFLLNKINIYQKKWSLNCWVRPCTVICGQWPIQPAALGSSHSRELVFVFCWAEWTELHALLLILRKDRERMGEGYLFRLKQIKQMGVWVISPILSFWNPKTFVAKALEKMYLLKGSQPESCPSKIWVKIAVLSVLIK